MPANQVQFTPSASATLQATFMPSTVTLPPADPANPVVVLQNQGPGPVAIMAGSISYTVAEASGAILVRPGQSVLAQNAGLSDGTVATVQAQGGATLVFTRGKLSDLWLFPAP